MASSLDMMEWYGLDWSRWRYGSVEGSCEHCNEPSGSIKFWEILEWLCNWRLLKKGSAAWSPLCLTSTFGNTWSRVWRFGKHYSCHVQGCCLGEGIISRVYWCWASPARPFLVHGSTGLMTIFFLCLPSHLLSLVSCSSDFRPWRWRWYVLPKRRFIYGLHGTISQKMEIFINYLCENLKYYIYFIITIKLLTTMQRNGSVMLVYYFLWFI
jgi:hypothetical protein